MKLRTIIGTIFIAASLTKLACLLDILNWPWFKRVTEEPWAPYFAIAILIYVGVNLILEDLLHNRDRWLQRPVPQGEDGKRAILQVSFGGDEYVWNGEPFNGARMDATFGGLKVDLRGARVTEDEEIDIHTCFGGVELFVPADVNVVVKSRSFIGGVGNEARRNAAPGTPCLHVVASNIIGGVSIKN